MNKEIDGCTCFFDTWFRYGEDLRIELFDLSELCNVHDIKCSSTEFLKLLIKHRVVFGILIGLFASVGCWLKYPVYMWNRL